jgi:hypothetical protein
VVAVVIIAVTVVFVGMFAMIARNKPPGKFVAAYRAAVERPGGPCRGIVAASLS